ncbi:polypyrimidine tract-binding protein-like protein 3 [Gossypium australe]|uniref:Polypyrimidine tract-binding protein-like protein 3 n=1 Tax=Gossypium australe TaxID=47621 RepID=A0A5B6WW31_9ROSI|nr:polypyrimidine tract-binding protein-like protein 3 [Gossypium australe]
MKCLHLSSLPHPVLANLLGFQALIQYQGRQNAISARTSLQGRNIYDGCCQLDIQFSNLDELQVHYNNERSRDFTNPNLPTEQKGRSSQHPGYGDAGGIWIPTGGYCSVHGLNINETVLSDLGATTVKSVCQLTSLFLKFFVSVAVIKQTSFFPAWQMLLSTHILFVASFCGKLLEHAFYSSLANRKAFDQTWIVDIIWAHITHIYVSIWYGVLLDSLTGSSLL